MPLSGSMMLLYGRVLEFAQNGDNETRRAFLKVSEFLRAQADDLQGVDLAEWDKAQKALEASLDERSEPVSLAAQDVVAVRNNVVVIENAALADRLRVVAESQDLQGISFGFWIKIT